jgi:hypothetical protein
MHNRRLGTLDPRQFARSGEADHGGGKAAAASNAALTNLTTLDEEPPLAILKKLMGRAKNRTAELPIQDGCRSVSKADD